MYLVPGISWKRSPTRNGLTVADYISTTTNVIVARLLCACSRDSIVWPSYAHDVRQATCSRAAQPLHHRTVTSIPIDSSNRNIVVKFSQTVTYMGLFDCKRIRYTITIAWCAIRRGSTLLPNDTLLECTWVPGISRGSGARREIFDGLTVG